MASRVAHTLDVDGLKQATPKRLFEQWRAYRRLFPFGDDWRQTGVMAAAAINPHVKRQRSPSEFVPAMPIARKQTTEQVVNNLNQWLKVFQGGRN